MTVVRPSDPIRYVTGSDGLRETVYVPMQAPWDNPKSLLTALGLPVGSRVRHLSDDRIFGVIEEYEFPDRRGRIFVRTDAGPGYWFNGQALIENTP